MMVKGVKTIRQFGSLIEEVSKRKKVNYLFLVYLNIEVRIVYKFSSIFMMTFLLFLRVIFCRMELGSIRQSNNKVVKGFA